jgi:hypothetical protein
MLSKKNHGEHGEHGEKEEKALWKKGSAYLTTKLIPVFPALPVVPDSSEFNSRPGLT